jgi:hypothetical protein
MDNWGIGISKFDLFAAGVAAVLVSVLAVFFNKTRVGRALRAVADDHQAALAIGIPLQHIWRIVWAVAGFVALVAGLMWGARNGVQFALTFVALKALPVLILGGFDLGARRHRRRPDHRRLREAGRGVHRARCRRRHRRLVPLRAGAAVPAGAARRPVRREAYRQTEKTDNLCSTEKPASSRPPTPEDQQIFPIRQDRIGHSRSILGRLRRLVLPCGQPVLAAGDPDPGADLLAGGDRPEHPHRLRRPALARHGGLHGGGRLRRLQLHAAHPGMPILVAFVLGGLCAAAVGIVFGLPSLRIKGFYLAVATLAAQFFIVWALTKFPGSPTTVPPA